MSLSPPLALAEERLARVDEGLVTIEIEPPPPWQCTRWDNVTRQGGGALVEVDWSGRRFRSKNAKGVEVSGRPRWHPFTVLPSGHVIYPSREPHPIVHEYLEARAWSENNLASAPLMRWPYLLGYVPTLGAFVYHVLQATREWWHWIRVEWRASRCPDSHYCTPAGPFRATIPPKREPTYCRSPRRRCRIVREWCAGSTTCEAGDPLRLLR